MGIQITATVEMAVRNRRRRRHRAAILNQMENDLQQFRDKGLNSNKDVRLWRSNEESYRPVFSSKETWKQTRQKQPQVTWAKGIWFAYATPKFSLMAWLTALNRLSTGERMKAWNENVDSSCVLCANQEETRDHLFFQCPFAEEVWRKLASGLFGEKFTTCWTQNLATLVDSSQEKTKLYLCRYTFQATIHSIWRERNARKHGDSPQQPSLLIKNINKNIRNRLSSLTSLGANKYSGALQMWFAYQASVS